MNILAIETSTLYESIAISRDKNIVAAVTIKVKKTHSEQLLPIVNEMLDQINMTRNDLSGIAVTIGPGSFTGLRIGLSTAKGLCFGLNIPLYVTSTLKCLANNIYQVSSQVCVLMDAGRGEFYFAIYYSSLHEVHEPAIGTLDQITKLIGDVDTIFIGPAVLHIRQEILNTLDTLNLARDIDCYPRAASLIDIIQHNKGFTLLNSQEIISAEPLYIRKSTAEENVIKTKIQNNRK